LGHLHFLTRRLKIEAIIDRYRHHVVIFSLTGELADQIDDSTMADALVDLADLTFGQERECPRVPAWASENQRSVINAICRIVASKRYLRTLWWITACLRDDEAIFPTKYF